MNPMYHGPRREAMSRRAVRRDFLDTAEAAVYHAAFQSDKERDVIGFVPKEVFVPKGVGKHREKLTSFELALRSAGIAACNLVRVSSIFPPKCRILPRKEGPKLPQSGTGT